VLRPTRRDLYLKRLERIDGVEVWRVDGHLIRDRVDIEFTNGHHHFTRPFIPRSEIWLDREAPGAGEWPFWALHQVVQRRCMEKGASYLSALRIASRHEREERRRTRGGEGPVTTRDIQSAARRRLLGTIAGREVWLVDGRVVRDLAYVDFTLGGHGYRYRFIPRREIWIDDAVRPAERASVLHHEVVEVGLMADGMKYDEAHAHASAAETHFRRRALRAHGL
jgi:hypothetical protein